MLSRLFLESGHFQYIRYTLVTHTNEMKRLVICGAYFFVNTETRFFGPWSRIVS